MKKSIIYLVVAIIGFAVLGNVLVAFGADEPQQQSTQRETMGTPPPAPPMMGRNAPGMWQGRQCPMGCRPLCFLLLVLFFCHILLATWVFMDMKKFGYGNGIFIVLVLLAGFPAAVVYALVRIGDAKRGTPPASS